MIIKTSDTESIKSYLKKLFIPQQDSHKGQNGKVLVIGGSHLFHAASIWSAITASYFIDMVHYSSIVENNEVMTSLKKKFRAGIVVPQTQIPVYIKEDDAILVGPGMVRGPINSKFSITNAEFSSILKITDEPTFTYALTNYLIQNFPKKQFIFDAGVLQMIDKNWLQKLVVKPILTPHREEYKILFGEDLSTLSDEKKKESVKQMAKKNNCILIVKAVDDFISDGDQSIQVVGGNAGLTKGGTGDVLAGLISAFCAKNDPLEAAVVSSYILKKSAEMLYLRYNTWYNVDTLIDTLPQTLSNLLVTT